MATTTKSSIFLTAIFILIQPSLSFKHPEDCQYFLDSMGRNKVLCDKGGMEGSLDVAKVDPKTEVLEITAPEDNLNSLIIGPIFGSFTKIEEIHIMRSNIPEIGAHSFWRLLSLEVLNLRENNISTVLDLNFKGLPNLKYLYLDDNRIDRLPSGTFRDLVSLRVLSLARNRLDELVTRVFENLSKLHELNLSENFLESLNPEVFVDIQDLKVLQCRSCGLKVISNNVYRLIPQLTTLDLGNNALDYIAPEHFADLPNLQSLWLDRNKILSLSNSTFSVQTSLKKLNIARNGLTTLPVNIFKNLTELMHLDLSYNSLTQLDVETFEPFASRLQILDLSGNKKLPPAEFKEVLQVCRKINYLSLADMELSELPLGLFDFSVELLRLNLAANRFVHFPVGALSPVARLSELDLSKNLLKGLDDKSLLRLESINRVFMQSNKWACDLCHIVPVLEKMNRSLYLQELKCHSPYYLKNRMVGSLQIHDLKRCSSNDLLYEDDDFIAEGRLGVIAAGAGLLLLVLTVVSLLAGVCYSRRHAANYYTHEEKRNMENDPMFDNTDILFSDNGELSFKFPMDSKISIIDEIKKDPDIQMKGS